MFMECTLFLSIHHLSSITMNCVRHLMRLDARIMKRNKESSRSCDVALKKQNVLIVMNSVHLKWK